MCCGRPSARLFILMWLCPYVDVLSSLEVEVTGGKDAMLLCSLRWCELFLMNSNCWGLLFVQEECVVSCSSVMVPQSPSHSVHRTVVNTPPSVCGSHDLYSVHWTMCCSCAGIC